jgi:hypothetical protein
MCVRWCTLFMKREFLVILSIIFLASAAQAQNKIAAPIFPHTKTHLESAILPPEAPIQLSVGAKLLKVINIEPASKDNPKIVAEFKLQTNWIDDRLATSFKDPNEVLLFQDEEATVQLAKMFDPRVIIVDGTSEFIHRHLRIYSGGAVELREVVTVTVSADMNLLHFPFDSQIFTFRFASIYWDQHSAYISLNSLETGIMDDASPESWLFDYSSYHVTTAEIRGHSETYSVLDFSVHAQRDPRYFLWRLIIPLLVIVILSWNVFWIYEDSSAALANCVVFLLTVVAFHQIANGMLPMIPYFTFIDSIVFICYGFIIIPTFQVMVTTKMERRGKKGRAYIIRKNCRWLVPIIFVLSLLFSVLGYFSQG